MKNNLLPIRFFSLILAAALLLSGCGLIQVNEGGAMRKETHSVDLDSAASVKVHVEMDIGALNISSGSDKLMEGTFEYNVREWKPQVQYEVNGSQGTLLVNQPDKKPNSVVKNGENTWDLRLSESIPMELAVEVGAGDSEIDLTRVDMTELSLETGLGRLDLDLRGNWTHDLNINIHGGIGDVTLYLPDEMGVRVEVTNGIGSVNNKGMDKNGDVYVNGSYGNSPYTLNIRIEHGSGNVNLEA